MIPTLAAQIITQLELRPGSTALDISEALGVPLPAVAQELTRLLDQHRVVVTGSVLAHRSSVLPQYEVSHG